MTLSNIWFIGYAWVYLLCACGIIFSIIIISIIAIAIIIASTIYIAIPDTRLSRAGLF